MRPAGRLNSIRRNVQRTRATLGPMGKTFKQLRDEAMADPKRRAAIEREQRELRERVNRQMKETAEAVERLRTS